MKQTKFKYGEGWKLASFRNDVTQKTIIWITCMCRNERLKLQTQINSPKSKKRRNEPTALLQKTERKKTARQMIITMYVTNNFAKNTF